MSEMVSRNRTAPRHGKVALFTSFGITLVLGLLATSVAVIGTLAPAKALIAIGGAVFGVAFVLLLNDSRRLELILIGALAVTLSINLDVNFLWREHTGVPSIYISVSMLIMAALYATWLYRYLTGQMDPLLRYRRMLLWAQLTYMVWGCVTMVNARDVSLIFIEQYQNIVLLSAALATMNIRARRDIGVFVACLAGAVLLQGTLASLQYATGSTFGLEIFGERELIAQDVGFTAQRSSGTVGHPNALGYFFEITLPLVLALLLTPQPLVRRAGYLLVIVLGLIGMFTTLSRGAWVTLPVSFSFVFFLLFSQRLFRLSSFIGFCIVGAVVVGSMSFALPTIKARFLHNDNRSAWSRIELNAASWSVIEQHPVAGVGLNNLSEVFFDLDRTGRSYVMVGPAMDGLALVMRHRHHVVHNMYLWIWSETGLVGLVAFVWIFACVFLMGISIYARGDPWRRHVVVGLLGGILAHLAHGMIDPGFRLVGNVALMLYCYMGLVGALSMIGNADDPARRARAGQGADLPHIRV